METLDEFKLAIRAARSVQRSLGTRRAAGYLRNRGFSLLAALTVLVGDEAADRSMRFGWLP